MKYELIKVKAFQAFHQLFWLYKFNPLSLKYLSFTKNSEKNGAEEIRLLKRSGYLVNSSLLKEMSKKSE